MTIKLGGVDVADVRVGGAQAQRVMVGTGTTAVEAWSAAVYPVSGTWGPTPYTSGGAHTMGSHTITENDTYTITAQGTSTSGYLTVSVRTPVAQGQGTVAVTAGDVTAATVTHTLTVGQLVEVRVSGFVDGTTSGTWSITKA